MRRSTRLSEMRRASSRINRSNFTVSKKSTTHSKTFPNAFGKVLECVVDFFDTVKFDRLMRLLARRISDKRVLRLIGVYLRAGVKLRDGKRSEEHTSELQSLRHLVC